MFQPSLCITTEVFRAQDSTRWICNISVSLNCVLFIPIILTSNTESFRTSHHDRSLQSCFRFDYNIFFFFAIIGAMQCIMSAQFVSNFRRYQVLSHLKKSVDCFSHIEEAYQSCLLHNVHVFINFYLLNSFLVSQIGLHLTIV